VLPKRETGSASGPVLFTSCEMVYNMYIVSVKGCKSSKVYGKTSEM